MATLSWPLWPLTSKYGCRIYQFFFLHTSRIYLKNTVKVGVLNKVYRSDSVGNEEDGHSKKIIVWKSNSN